MSDIDREFAMTVGEEVAELLMGLEETVLELEASPQDLGLVSKVFRVMHTIKGSAGMAGFDTISDFTHHVETVLDKVRSGLVPVSRDLITLILASRDHIKELLAEALGEEGGVGRSGEEILSSLRELVKVFIKTRKSRSSVAAAPEHRGSNDTPPRQQSKPGHYLVHLEPRGSSLGSSSDWQELLAELERLGEITVSRTGGIDANGMQELGRQWSILDILLTTSRRPEEVIDILIIHEDDLAFSIRELEGDFPDGLPCHKLLGEILIERNELTPEALKNVLESQKPLGELLVEKEVVSESKVRSALAAQELIGRQRSYRPGNNGDTLKVSSERLDKQVNLIGELVVAQSQMNLLAREISDAGLTKTVKNLERLTGEIRDNVLEMRMVPVGTTFSRFKRLVRDLAGELGKDIEFRAEGGEAELDKSIIDQLGEPLVHLIRNAVDHGVENSRDRLAAGKRATGLVSLAAYQSGANVMIEISDDGQGLDRERIREKAIALEAIPQDTILNQEELFKLIFAPGMSTAEQVTSVSGRGVGMDVVKSTIEEKLKGEVSVESESGAGTKVTITLPLTLAIIDGLLVRAGTGRYILPMVQVEKCVTVSRQEFAENPGRRVFVFQGSPVPYVRLREFFKIEGKLPDEEQIVVVEIKGERFGLALDEVEGGQQAVIRSLGWACRDAEGISGATILGDGAIAMVVDVAELLRLARQEERRAVG